MKKIIIGIVLSLSVALLSFIAVSCGEEYKALPAPQNFRQYYYSSTNRDILWDEVPDALGYVVTFAEKEYEIDKTKLDLPKDIQPGMYEIEVYAYGSQGKISATAKYKFRIAEDKFAADNGLMYDLLSDGESYRVSFDLSAEYIVGTLEIPSAVNGLHVKEIMNLGKIKNMERIPNYVTTRVIIPSTVEKIRGLASFLSLEEIEIPDSVKNIGSMAFVNCRNLKEVKISEHSQLEVINDSAFSWCSSLNKITLPKGLKRIDSGAFQNCSSLTDIVLPNSIETLGKWLFRYCPLLTKITLPNSLETLEQALKYSSISEVVIPHSLKNMGKQPFPECIQKIYYEGTQAEWEALSAQYNGDLEKPFYDAKIYYYSDAPADNCWRYVDGNPTPWNGE